MSLKAPPREPDQIPDVPLPEERRHVFGHDAVRTELAGQLAERRLPGALLLHGPRGIGKATLAFSFARDILLATGDESALRVGEQIAAGVHPNVFVLRRKPRDAKGFYSVIRVEEVREFRASLTQTRGRAGYRACIVDAIDDCNISSANALLKILEEPPPETLFILVSHRPGGLLPTIRSRCHAHAMRPLGTEDMREVLADLATGDIVRLAGGRPRRAFEIAQLGEATALTALRAWLDDPAAAPAATQLSVADALAGAGETELLVGRELIAETLAAEARAAAGDRGDALRLASASELWEKAHARLADADVYNLDMRQTLVSIFDDLRQHALRHSAQQTSPQ